MISIFFAAVNCYNIEDALNFVIQLWTFKFIYIS